MSQTASQIGLAFLQRYYTAMSVAPTDLIGMYKQDAHLATPDGEFDGSEEIATYVNSIATGRKYRIHSVGAYDSIDSAVVVVAKGIQLTANDSVAFSQTFVLVKVMSNQYCIRNDVFINFPVAQQLQADASVEEPVPEVAEPEVEEVVPEPEPEVVEEPVEPTPTPTPAAKSPVSAPAPAVAEPAPVKEKVVEEVITGSDWASRLRRAQQSNGTETLSASTKQVVAGGAVPRQQPVTRPVEEKKADVSTRGKGPRHSIYVSMGTQDFKEADIDKLFAKFGRILGKTLKTEKQFAFVDFAEKKAAEAALQAAKDGIKFNGRDVRCQLRQEEKKTDSKESKPRTAAPAAAPAARRK